MNEFIISDDSMRLEVLLPGLHVADVERTGNALTDTQTHRQSDSIIVWQC